MTPLGSIILAIRYTEVAFVEGLFCTQTVYLKPGLYITVDHSPRVAIKRGFTIILIIICPL